MQPYPETVEILRVREAATRRSRSFSAVIFGDNLIYNEPADWQGPVRQSLGAVLLAAGRPAEAEAVFWPDLRRNRENGWAWSGLLQSLRDQGRQAAPVEGRFRQAWSRSDGSLSASPLMGEANQAIAATNAPSRADRP
jgi:predicted Zn-dependent protease